MQPIASAAPATGLLDISSRSDDITQSEPGSFPEFASLRSADTTQLPPFSLHAMTSLTESFSHLSITKQIDQRVLSDAIQKVPEGVNQQILISRLYSQISRFLPER